MMSPELLFSITNGLAVLAWLLLAAMPGRRWVTDIVTGKAVPMLFAVLYVVIVATTIAGAEGSFSTLTGVATLFTNPWLLVAGWLHYLAFDLLIGTWEARDACERGIPQLLLVPCLFATLMFGPAGWLLYMVISRTSGPRAMPQSRPVQIP
jgi:hypothetical protein